MNENITKKVVVDAGHGGSDPGAINGNIREKDFNLISANYIYNRLPRRMDVFHGQRSHKAFRPFIINDNIPISRSPNLHHHSFHNRM